MSKDLVSWKIRILKFGIKISFLGSFRQKFWKTIVIFEISELQLVLLQRLVQKTKTPFLFGTKNARFAYFKARIWANLCHNRNQQPQIWLISKFHKIWKCLNLRSKIPCLRFFGLQVWKTYYQIWNQYPQICLLQNFAK